MSKDSDDLADTIGRLQHAYVVASLLPVVINIPEFRPWLVSHGFDMGSTTRFGRRDDTYTRDFLLDESLTAAVGRVGANLDMLGMPFFAIIATVGDQLKGAPNLDRTPLIEYFRHLRNAVSHGNRWSFMNGEPRRPAAFRSFTLLAAQHGDVALFETLSTGDVMDLLDDVAAHLRALP